MEATQHATLTVSASARQAADPTQIGRFKVLRRLGEGGMGVVYSAFDEQLGRRLAIKLLRSAADSTQGRANARREAQALARLSHPNVVQVYEVGELGEELFIAMEFVTGETLRAWMQRGDHDWRTTVEVFVQAGQGLAAAHAAGLVHRDFKPENAIIGEDGRARVLDFGLALEPVELPDDRDTGTTGVDMMGPTHGVGPVVGTPRYMSPEQHEGRIVDARSDQFSFCVALWEALHGEPPHAGETLVELVHNTVTGTLRPVPARATAPDWLHRVLTRSLAVNPKDRWPDMPALLAALRADPGVRRRRVAAAVLAVLVLVALVAVSLRRVDPCASVTEPAAAAWSATTQDTIAAAFTASGAPFAATSWALVKGQIDDYIGEWSEARQALCVAHEEARRSDELHDLGVECLEDRMSQLRAQLDALTDADALAVEKVASLRSRLRPISGCADLRALRARPRPPDGLAVRATAELLRARLEGLAARRELGDDQGAIAEAQALLVEAHRLDDGPLVAEALYELGRSEEALGRYDEAERDLQAAFFTAGRAYHDRVAASAAWRMCIIDSQVRADLGASMLWSRHMEVATSRLGDPGELLADLHNARGTLFYREGRYLEARTEIERARELLAQVAPGDELARARYTFNLGVMHKALGEFAAAQSAYDDAYAVTLRLVGAEHPLVLMLELNRGSLLLTQGRFPEAERTLLRALGLAERRRATNLAGTSMIAYNLGEVARGAGRLDDASTWLRRALDGRTRVLGASHRDTAQTRASLGAVLHRIGRAEEARVALERAEADLRDQTGAGDLHAAALTLHGEFLLAQGELAEARRRLEQAVATNAATEAGARRELVETRTLLAGLALREGHVDEAIEHAQLAHAAAQDGLDWPQVRADATVMLLRARRAAAAPTPELVTLAREADAQYEAAGPHTAAARAALAGLLAGD